MNRKKNRLQTVGAASIGFLLALVICFWRLGTSDFPYYLEVVQIEHGGFGYKIYEGDRPIIYQPFIPEVSGKKSFRTQKEAENVGNLVLQRISNKENFSISKNDLRQLDIYIE